jgi:hypothetical protein
MQIFLSFGFSLLLDPEVLARFPTYEEEARCDCISDERDPGWRSGAIPKEWSRSKRDPLSLAPKTLEAVA